MTDLEQRIFRIVTATRVQADIPGAIVAEIERTHVIVPVKYSKCDSETTIYRLLLEEAILTNVSLLESAIEGRISEVLHGDSIRIDAANSDASETLT